MSYEKKNLISPEQLFFTLAVPVVAENFTTSGGTTDDVTSAVQTVCQTAGRGGIAVPSTKSTGNDSFGIVVLSPFNLAEIFDNSTKDKLDDGSGNEVYGRLTESGGIYTLAYFSKVSGTETAYNMPVSTVIDFSFNYSFKWHELPQSVLLNITSKYVTNDVAVNQGRVYREQLTIVSTGSLPDLAKTPINGELIKLYINGVAEFNTTNGTFSNVGKVLTWNAVHKLPAGTEVIAEYNTFE